MAEELSDREFMLQELARDDLPPEEQDMIMDWLEANPADPEGADFARAAAEEFQSVPREIAAGMNIFANATQEMALDAVVTGLDVARAVADPLAPPEVSNALTARRNKLASQVDAMKANNRLTIAESYGEAANPTQKLMRNFWEVGGRIYPWLAFPTAGSTYMRTVLGQAALGGFAGAAEAENAAELSDRFGEMTWGAALGAFGSGLLNAKQGLETFAARKLARELRKNRPQENAKLEEQVQKLTGDPDFSFSLGQITGNPFIIGLEIGAAKQVQRDAQVGRMKTLTDFLKLRANSLRSNGAGPTEIARDLQGVIRDLSKTMRKTAGENYATGMENIMQHWGDESVVRGTTYLDELRQVRAALTDPMLGGSSTAVPRFLDEQIVEVSKMVEPAKLRVLRDENNRVVREVFNQRTGEVLGTFRGRGSNMSAARLIERYNMDNGQLDADQVKRLMEGFRRINSEVIPAFENAAPGGSRELAGQLRNAMLKEMEVGATNPDAIEAVKSLRKIYEFDMRQMDSYSNVLNASLFGDVSAIGDVRGVLNQFVNKDPRDMAEIRRILANEDPALLNNLRAHAIETMYTSGRINDRASMSIPGSPAGGEAFSLEQLADAMMGTSRLPGSASRGLWEPREAEEIGRVARALNVMRETHLKLFPEQAQGTLQDVAINTISRSPEFFARFLVRLTGSSNAVSRVLNDPFARRAVLRIADSGVGTPGARAASLYLSLVAAQYISQDEQEERQRIEEAMRVAPEMRQ